MPYIDPDRRNRSQEAHRQLNKEKLWKLLSSSECNDCGHSDPRVLEFDHVRGVKRFDIARAVCGSTRSWRLIKEEIDKCDIVCANCHRVRTSRRGGHWRYWQP